jgi:hypothetical protein
MFPDRKPTVEEFDQKDARPTLEAPDRLLVADPVNFRECLVVHVVLLLDVCLKDLPPSDIADQFAVFRSYCFFVDAEVAIHTRDHRCFGGEVHGLVLELRC